MVTPLKYGQHVMPITACESFEAELRWQFHSAQAIIRRKQQPPSYKRALIDELRDRTKTTTTTVIVPALNPTLPNFNIKRHAAVATITAIAPELVKKTVSIPTYVTDCTRTSQLSSACSCILGSSTPVRILTDPPSPSHPLIQTPRLQPPPQHSPRRSPSPHSAPPAAA